MTASGSFVYRAKPGARFPGRDAQEIGEELSRLAIVTGGALTPAVVVDAAERKRSPLHKHFEWDDIRAARLYRETQARHLMNHIDIVVKDAETESETSLRAFHSIKVVEHDDEDESSADGAATRKYIPLSRITEDSEMAEAVIASAREDLQGWKTRYESYRKVLPEFGKRFQPVFEAVEKV